MLLAFLGETKIDAIDVRGSMARPFVGSKPVLCFLPLLGVANN